ncbi:MAG TPA: chloride channel protein [Anaerolineales bacterium]|nr:chloride channel protein [Anaerolineales bacterium]
MHIVATPLSTGRTILRDLLFGCWVGILTGVASAVFLISLQWVTELRLAQRGWVYLLPLGGLAVGSLYYYWAGKASQGSHLVVGALNRQVDDRIPRRMTPLVLLGTLLTHWVGGSAGREGTAVQMGASLAEWVSTALKVSGVERGKLLRAGVSGGFASVFGTPLAGFVFSMEVSAIGRVRYEGFLMSLTAAIVGDWTARWLGASHSHYPSMVSVPLQWQLILLSGLAGMVFGLTSRAFVWLTRRIKQSFSDYIPYPPARPMLGGVLLLAAALLVGSRDTLGLSLPLIQASMQAEGVVWYAFALKLMFTALTLGSGFVGGEVTPLFVMGATLGHTLGKWVDIDPQWMAQLGFVAVFAGASNTPLACVLMGIELFGAGSAIYLAIACFSAYLVSGHSGIYHTQIVDVPKPTVNS